MTREEIFTFPAPPAPLPEPVSFAAVGLAHGHINGMCSGLQAAGGVLRCAYDLDPVLLENFCKAHPGVTACRSEEEILERPDIRLIASAAIPIDRADIGIRAMKAGKHFFVDKAPLVTEEQLDAVRAAVKETGKRYAVYYSEGMHNEAAVFAADLIRRGVIGPVFHMEGLAPHLLGPENRPDWFFRREQTGGILIDIGSQQTHQLLTYAGCAAATVDAARAGNFFCPAYPGFDDSGDMTLTAENGVTGYFHIDWHSPAGLHTWGDARTFIEGRDGYIELRKNCDPGGQPGCNHVLVVNGEGIFREDVTGKVPFPAFAAVLNTCLTGEFDPAVQETEFEAIRLAIRAQKISGRSL